MGEPGAEDEDGQGTTASSPSLSHLSRLRSVCSMRRLSSLAVEVDPGPSSAPPILSMTNVAQLRSSMCRRSSLLVCSDLEGPDAPATAAAAAVASPCRVRRVSIMDAETAQALAPPTRPQATTASPRVRRVSIMDGEADMWAQALAPPRPHAGPHPRRLDDGAARPSCLSSSQLGDDVVSSVSRRAVSRRSSLLALTVERSACSVGSMGSMGSRQWGREREVDGGGESADTAGTSNSCPLSPSSPTPHPPSAPYSPRAVGGRSRRSSVCMLQQAADGSDEVLAAVVAAGRYHRSQAGSEPRSQAGSEPRSQAGSDEPYSSERFCRAGALGSPPANTPPSPTFRSRVVAARCRTLQPAAVAATHSLLCSCQAARGAGPAQGGGPPSPTGSWIQGRCPTGSARVQDPVPGSSNGRTSVFLVTTAVMAVRRHGAVMAATTRMVAVALLSGRQRQR